MRSTDPAAIRAAIARFLDRARRPELLEPGEEFLAISPDSFVCETRAGGVTLEAWDEHRNLVRKVVALERESPEELRLTVARFGKRTGPLFLIDRARAGATHWQGRGDRLVFGERWRRMLMRQFPGWRVAELATDADLQHSLSPAYPRAMLRSGSAALAAIAAPPDSLAPDHALAFGLIWHDYLRRREPRLEHRGLALFLPRERERVTAWRLRCLAIPGQSLLFSYDEHDEVIAADPHDYGNLDTRLDLCRRPLCPSSETLERLLAIQGVERIARPDGAYSLRVRGLEFATAGDVLRFGLHERRPLQWDNAEECESLARQLAAMRHPERDPRNELYRLRPEAWLESQVRACVETIDARLLPEPIYGQVPAFTAGDRGVLDLLAMERGGRLTVIELKAEADLQLPLQALDYWMRVAWHAQRGEFGSHGYFPGLEPLPDPPRLALIAPALEFHPTTETLLSYFAPHIEVERIGLGVEWRKATRVMLRLQRDRRPR